MGNIIVKQNKSKPAIAFETTNKNNYLLKQIHSGDIGDCNICKKKSSTGFKIYNIDIDRTVFVCCRCYIIGA